MSAWSQLITRFPRLPQTGIIVNPNTPTGTFSKLPEVWLDVEARALTIEQAAARSASLRARPHCIYISLDEVGPMGEAVGGFKAPAAWPAPGPYLNVADWTNEPHCPAEALLCQYTSPTVNPAIAWDVSLVNPASIYLLPTNPIPIGDDLMAPEIWTDAHTAWIVYPSTGHRTWINQPEALAGLEADFGAAKKKPAAEINQFVMLPGSDPNGPAPSDT